MPTVKKIFVTGGTGNQGGAVIRHLLKNGFKVKALTRDPISPAALQLKEMGADLVEGNLDLPATYEDHLQGVYGVFAVLALTKHSDREIRQGVALANLAKDNSVEHYVYSSVSGADLSTGIPHFESKFKIEKHIKQIGLPYTIVRPVSLFENFLIPQVRSRLLKGKLVHPIQKHRVQQYIASEDVGSISCAAFMDHAKYLGRTITIATEEMDGEQVATIFSKVWEREIRYRQLPWIITRLAMGKDLYKMFRWADHNNGVFVKDLERFKKEFPNLLGLEEWIKEYFE
jgi:uncharacterized protein YbjT (DUF2867 family)